MKIKWVAQFAYYLVWKFASIPFRFIIKKFNKKHKEDHDRNSYDY